MKTINRKNKKKIRKMEKKFKLIDSYIERREKIPDDLYYDVMNILLKGKLDEPFSIENLIKNK